MTREVRLGSTPFAVVDIETTGIYPTRHDRIIEVGIVTLTPELDIANEWSSLVNPKRDIGRSDMHGIQAGDVAHAPTFEEIAGDVGMRLRDAIVVGHNLRFDTGFLSAEFARANIALPSLPSLCTLNLAYRLLPEAPSRKLGYCCQQVGILHEEEHSALGDARATGYLLAVLVAQARQRGLSSLRDLDCDPLSLPPDWLGSVEPSAKRLVREAAAGRQREERSYLAKLVEGMLGDDSRNAREAEYLALVDRALEDRRVTKDEAELLMNMAESWGMTRSDIREAHRAYLDSLASEALADRQVTPAEREDLETVCDLLGLHRAALDVLLSEPMKRVTTAGTAVLAPSDGSLRGKSVCFTGEIVSAYRGERITRELAEKMASEAGLEVRASVTKKLDILVVADPDTQSIKAKKARTYGIRIMAEVAFWKSVGIRVD